MCRVWITGDTFTARSNVSSRPAGPPWEHRKEGPGWGPSKPSLDFRLLQANVQSQEMEKEETVMFTGRSVASRSSDCTTFFIYQAFILTAPRTSFQFNHYARRCNSACSSSPAVRSDRLPCSMDMVTAYRITSCIRAKVLLPFFLASGLSNQHFLSVLSACACAAARREDSRSMY